MASTAVDRPKEAAALRRLVPADGFAFALTAVTIAALATSQGWLLPDLMGMGGARVRAQSGTKFRRRIGRGQDQEGEVV